MKDYTDFIEIDIMSGQEIQEILEEIDAEMDESFLSLSDLNLNYNNNK